MSRSTTPQVRASTDTTTSYSSAEGGQCVEIATCPHAIHIRDSKHPRPTGPHLTLSPTTWSAFLRQTSV